MIKWTPINGGHNLPRGPELQVLDYQTQQMKLLPLLASAYALIQTGQYMIRQYIKGRSEIAQGNLDVMPEVCVGAILEGD